MSPGGEFREAFNRYLARVGPDAPVKNLAEFRMVGFIASKPPGAACGPEDGTQSSRTAGGERSPAPSGHDVIAHNDLDALFRVSVSSHASARSNSSAMGYYPVGRGFLPSPSLAALTNTQRPSVPIVSNVGRVEEAHLIRLAYAFEQAAQPPGLASTPAWAKSWRRSSAPANAMTKQTESIAHRSSTGSSSASAQMLMIQRRARALSRRNTRADSRPLPLSPSAQEPAYLGVQSLNADDYVFTTHTRPCHRQGDRKSPRRDYRPRRYQGEPGHFMSRRGRGHHPPQRSSAAVSPSRPERFRR